MGDHEGVAAHHLELADALEPGAVGTQGRGGEGDVDVRRIVVRGLYPGLGDIVGREHGDGFGDADVAQAEAVAFGSGDGVQAEVVVALGIYAHIVADAYPVGRADLDGVGHQSGHAGHGGLPAQEDAHLFGGIISR